MTGNERKNISPLCHARKCPQQLMFDRRQTRAGVRPSGAHHVLVREHPRHTRCGDVPAVPRRREVLLLEPRAVLHLPTLLHHCDERLAQQVELLLRSAEVQSLRRLTHKTMIKSVERTLRRTIRWLRGTRGQSARTPCICFRCLSP